jgi:hypothetical protein
MFFSEPFASNGFFSGSTVLALSKYAAILFGEGHEAAVFSTPL